MATESIHKLMAAGIEGNFMRVECTVEAYLRFGRTGEKYGMMESSRVDSLTAEECVRIHAKAAMKVSSRTVSSTVEGCRITPPALGTTVNGCRVSTMVGE